MAEALREIDFPQTIGRLPDSGHPNHSNMPLHLLKATGEYAIERAVLCEERVRDLLASDTDTVEHVFWNEPYSKEDLLDQDLALLLKGRVPKEPLPKPSPLRVAYVQVKSSRYGIVAYKHEIRDELERELGQKIGPWIIEDVTRSWMAERGIILLNGSHSKSDAEILTSFYAQLERIQDYVEKTQGSDKTIQIFPNVLPTFSEAAMS